MELVSIFQFQKCEIRFGIAFLKTKFYYIFLKTPKAGPSNYPGLKFKPDFSVAVQKDSKIPSQRDIWQL